MDPELFRATREEIERLCRSAGEWIKQESFRKSQKHILCAKDLLKGLNKSANGTIQKRSVSNLDAEINYLINLKNNLILEKKPIKRKKMPTNRDGNIAFKCNWNDMNYQAPCSDEIYEFNCTNMRPWCVEQKPDCRRSYDQNVSKKNFPCYESIALKEMMFGAGWANKNLPKKPKHIKSVKSNRIAMLTTVPPNCEEKDRFVIGLLFIKKITNHKGKETIIIGDKDLSVKIPYNRMIIRFWDYYNCEEKENKAIWTRPLFRYISNQEVLNLLTKLIHKYNTNHNDFGKIVGLLNYYRDLVGAV